MGKIVISAPYFEPATEYWSPYLKGWVQSELKKRGHDVVVLWADDAVRDKVKQAMANADALCGVGHGNEQVFTGQNYDYIYQVGDDVPELAGKCFAPVSCLVGNELLPYLISKGTACGLGEIVEYTFVVDPTKSHSGDSPDEDTYLKPFLIAEYTFWFKLAEGASAGEAYDAMISEYMNQAKIYDSIDPETASWLRYDANFRKFFGTRDWKLPGGQPPQPPPQCPYKCPWCGFESSDAGVMKAHIEEVHSGDICPPCKHQCPVCGQEFDSETSLIVHYVSTHLNPCKLAKWFRRRLGCPIP